MKAFAAVLTALVMFSAAASAERYVSSTLGFSADFPGVVQTAEPQAPEPGAKHVPVSTITTVKSEVAGFYAAMVTVEMYNKPTTVGAGAVRTMISVFAAQLGAAVTSSKPVTVNGRKGRAFTYQSHDGKVTGAGMVLIGAAKKPRVYQVFTMYTPSASADDKAALDVFLKSFQLD
jgi:hypothetical protein